MFWYLDFELYLCFVILSLEFIGRQPVPSSFDALLYYMMLYNLSNLRLCAQKAIIGMNKRIKMKTKLFIDFDDTLFDGQKFKKDLFQIFYDLGFSEKEIKDSYDAVYDKENNGYAGVEAQLQYLDKSVKKFDLPAALQKAWNLLKNLEGYLFLETISFLNRIDRDKYDVQILTVGGKDFQRTKVRNSGIEEIVGEDNCHYTVDGKHLALSNLVKDDEHFILLEDKDGTIKEVNEKYPDATVLKAKEGNLLELGQLNGIIVDEVEQENDLPTRSRV